MAFALSKLLWALMSPGSLLAFLLAAGLAFGASSRAALAKTGKILCLFTAFCLVVIAVLPVGEWVLTPIENRFTFVPPDHVDGIIILGGDEQTDLTEARGTPRAFDSMQRYVTFLDLSRRYPEAMLIFSGGSGFINPHAKILDSEVARQVMTDIGVPTEHLIIEKTSRNTYENAVFTANIVHPEPQQKWLLVTSAWHMPRSMGCFRKAGWNVYAAPAGYYTLGHYRKHAVFQFDYQLHLLTIAEHEYMGLVSYYLMGRTSALWPKP